MSKTHNTPAYNTNGVRVAPYTPRELHMLSFKGTWAETYRAWEAGKSQRGTYRWPAYNEVQDALDAEG